MRFGLRILAATTASLVIMGSASAADYTIAAIKSLTGPLAFVGVPEANAIRMAIDELNEKNYLGEGNKLRLVLNDDQNDRGQLLSLLNRAVYTDNALIVLGTANSSLGVAVAPALNELKVPFFATAQTSAPLEVSPWYLKITQSPQGVILPVADYAVENHPLKRPVVVYGRDNDGQASQARMFRDRLASKGKPIVAEETILQSDTDFAALATKLVQLNPDAIWLGPNASQSANLVMQLKQAGVAKDIAMFGSSSLGSEDYIKTGGAAIENTFFWTDYNDQSTDPMNVAFVENYKKRYGTAPDNYSAVGYSETLIAAQAIKESMPDPTREKVLERIKAMKDTKVLLGNGSWSLDENRIPAYKPAIMVIRGGKPVLAP